MDFLEFVQYANKWQGKGIGRVDPYQIQYIECVQETSTKAHSKLHLINGNIIEVNENPVDLADKVKKYFDTHEDPNKIVLTRDDLIKSWLIRQIDSMQKRDT